MKRLFSPIATSGLLASLSLSIGIAAMAAEIPVTTFVDVVDDSDGVCSLREAVASANTDSAADAACVPGSAADVDRVLLAAGEYLLADSPNNALILTGSLRIRGVSPSYTSIRAVAEDNPNRALVVQNQGGAAVDVTLRSLRIAGGNADLGGNIMVEAGATLNLVDALVDGGQADNGGGIYNEGTLNLIRGRVEDNLAEASGGGVFNRGLLTAADSHFAGNTAQRGGAIGADAGDVTVSRSTITGNMAEEAGGGFWISSIDTFELFYSRVEQNAAGNGGGLSLAGDGPYDIFNSALIGNTATTQGGGLHSTVNLLFIRRSTLAENEAPEGGGARVDGSNQLFDFSTISANTGGGVFNQSGAFFENSLLASNTGGNCTGAPPQAGAYLNLDDGNTCQFAPEDPNDPQRINLVDTDPLLGPLADNGGPTPTYALDANSPAIDAISSDVRMFCAQNPDQRGYPRGQPPKDDGGQTVFLCDIGAFELHAPYIVDSTDDTVDEDTADGICRTAGDTCTLRAAVQQANATDGFEEIELPAGTFALTLLGADEDAAATGDLDLLDPVLIRGAGAGQTIIDGVGDDRVFDVMRPAKMIDPATPDTHFLEDLTIQNGSDGTDAGGAGLRIDRRDLRVERAVLAENSAEGIGGAVRCVSNCEMTFIDTRFTGNSSAVAGGAVGMDGDPDTPAEPIVIERSEFSGNSADVGGALSIFDLTLRNSTISANHALDPNPDVASGGGVAVLYGQIENSTIVANTGAADAGGGGVVLGSLSSMMTGTLLAQNTSGDGGVPDNCANFLTAELLSSGGHNLSDTGAADCNFDQADDLPDTDPLIDPLADNLGLTQTHALMPGSPAIDAGDDDNCPLTDQRGFLRPEDGDGDGTAACDIGAYELLGADLAVSISDDPDPVVVDDDITYTVTVTNNGPGPASQVLLSAELPAGLTFVSADAGSASCAESAGTLDCDIGELGAGENLMLTIVATATQAGTVTVTVTATAAEGDGMMADNSASETTTIDDAAGGGGGGGGGGGSSGGSSGGGSIGGLLLALLGLMFVVRTVALTISRGGKTGSGTTRGPGGRCDARPVDRHWPSVMPVRLRASYAEGRAEGRVGRSR